MNEVPYLEWAQWGSLLVIVLGAIGGMMWKFHQIELNMLERMKILFDKMLDVQSRLGRVEGKLEEKERWERKERS